MSESATKARIEPGRAKGIVDIPRFFSRPTPPWSAFVADSDAPPPQTVPGTPPTPPRADRSGQGGDSGVRCTPAPPRAGRSRPSRHTGFTHTTRPTAASPSARWHRGAPFSGPGARGRPPREATSTRLLRPFLSTALFDPPLRSFFSYSEGRRGVVKEKERSGGRRRGAVLGASLSVAAIPAGLPRRGCARQRRTTRRLKKVAGAYLSPSVPHTSRLEMLQ